MYLLIIFFSLFINICSATETLSLLNLSDQYNGMEVEVRGFYYEKEDGIGVLAAQPNLKSCCVGTKEKKEQQLVVSPRLGVISKATVVAVRGVLRAEEGLYFLDNAVKI